VTDLSPSKTESMSLDESSLPWLTIVQWVTLKTLIRLSS